jgi:hypothetical protein
MTDTRRPWLLRTPVLVGAVLVLALGVAFVAARRDLGPLAERPVARSGTLDVMASVWTDHVTGPTGDLVLEEAALVVRFRGEGRPASAVLVGSCGCRFAPSVLQWHGRDGRGFAAFPTFPRRDAELTLDLGDGALVRLPNPLPMTAARDAPAPRLPVTVEAEGRTWILLLDENPRYALVRVVDPQANLPAAWPLGGALFQDASGNRSRRAAEAPATQHRLWLPLDGPYALCPHEPWWELTIDGGVTFRFGPPPVAPR